MAVLSKATLAIDLIARAHQPVRLADVASQLGMPKSSAHRLLYELADLDLLLRDDSGRFTLGPRLMTWGQAAELSLGIRSVALPHMQQLCDLTGASVNLHIQQGDSRVCVATTRGANVLLPPLTIGQTLPLGVGATGKVLLAFSAETVQQEIFARMAADGAEVPSADDLSRTRATQWATSAHEQEVGLAACATVIRGPGGRVLAALALGGDIEQLSMEHLEELRPAVLSTAQTISDQLLGQRS